jgi:hypothetical protein
VCFVVLHSLQDHHETRTRDLDHPISCRCKKHQQLACHVGDLRHTFTQAILMVAPKLSFIANSNNPTDVGLAPGSTIHFRSLEFVANRFGHLSHSP